jgi:peptidoglycan/LPS O-acetylase OafA/YrhL
MHGQPRFFFPLVDVVRGFAAISVLVFHLITHWDWAAFPSTGPLAWFRSGWMAVDVFFVISGFVIGLSAFAGIDRHGSAFRAAFMRSRLARIVPLHYLTLLAFVVLIEPSLWGQGDFWTNLGAHLLFLHNLSFTYWGAINGPNWSLGAEMQFYVLMALAAPWLRTARPWKFVLLFIAIAWLWRWGAHAMTLPGPLDRAYMTQTQLPGMLDEFAIGLLLARFARSARGQAALARMQTDARLRWSLAGAVTLLWWGLFQVFMAHDFWDVQAMAVFFRTALAACAGLALLVVCGFPAPRGRIASAPLYLGKISYGIYLWHLPVLLFLKQHTQLEPLSALLVALSATIGLAALTWHAVEKPACRTKPTPPPASSRQTHGELSRRMGGL